MITQLSDAIWKDSKVVMVVLLKIQQLKLYPWLYGQ